ncbi:MAG: hypothetical protein ACNYPI_03045 [Arenicellales bacterium WSBS_2016_MAG_OTU3]
MATRSAIQIEKFDLDIIHSPLLVLGSADHLAQMLDKLADNAVDFSDPDTTILVRLQRANDKIALSITNGRSTSA